jgi:hypothetical protein
MNIPVDVVVCRKSSHLQRLAVTLDHSALWAIAASLEELRGKTGDAVKRTVP